MCSSWLNGDIMSALKKEKTIHMAANVSHALNNIWMCDLKLILIKTIKNDFEVHVK